MISAVSNQIVEDLGKGNFCAVHGISGAQNIKPLTIVIEETTSFLFFFNGKKKYTAYKFLISDILTENISGIEVTSKVIPAYKEIKTFEIKGGGKLSQAAFNEYPILKKKASLGYKVYMNIKSEGLALTNIDEAALNRKLTTRKYDESIELVKAHIGKSRYRFGVVKEVLEVSSKTVIDFLHEWKGDGELDNGDSSVNGDVKKKRIGGLTLTKDSVLACRWQLLIFDQKNKTIRLDFSSNDDSPDDDIVFKTAPSAANVETIEDQLSNLYSARKDDRELFKAAVNSVLESSSDIEALLDLFVDESGEEQAFTNQLQKRDAVWTLLELIGYELEDNNIVIKFDGPFGTLIPKVIESLSLVDNEDLIFIKQVNTYQREGLLRIIKATVANQTPIQIDSYLKSELHQEPVQNVLTVMDYTIDFIKGEVLPPSRKTCIIEAVFYLLSCL